MISDMHADPADGALSSGTAQAPEKPQLLGISSVTGYRAYTKLYQAVPFCNYLSKNVRENHAFGQIGAMARAVVS
jgi:hypothetical protein